MEKFFYRFFSKDADFFFQICLTFLSQNSDYRHKIIHHTTMRTGPRLSARAPCCDDSQLRVKNVEKNQKITESVKNPKISKLHIKVWKNTDHFLNSVLLWKNLLCWQSSCCVNHLITSRHDRLLSVCPSLKRAIFVEVCFHLVVSQWQECFQMLLLHRLSCDWYLKPVYSIIWLVMHFHPIVGVA